MTALRLLSIVSAALWMSLVPAQAAHAQATRTWVSGVGDDANPCSRVAPCKTFAGAISKTAAGGEISVLDPGGFGAVTITKAITINGDGTLAGILAAGTNGIVVSAGAADKVIIRSVSINGAGTGLNGIRYLAGGQLTIENVTINGFPASGSRCIDANLAASGELMVQNTNLTNCNSGVRLATTSGQLLATFDHVRIENMPSVGLEATAGSTFVTVKSSTINNNNVDGVRATGGSTIVNLENNMIAFNNGVAVNAAANGARIRISNNTIVNNNVGVAIGPGATVASAGNNRIDGNNSTTPPNVPFIQQ